ncbi:MAG: TolC family protein [Cycloclasticus sp.]
MKLSYYAITAVLMVLLSSNYVAAETLQQAWDIALKEDHSLKAVHETTRSSELQLQAAKAARFPSVSLGAGYTVLDDIPGAEVNFSGLSTQFPLAERESLSYSATSQLPIYTSGKISQSIKAASASLEASQRFELGKSLDLKLNVAEAYVAVLRSAKSLQLVNSHVESLASHLDDAKNLHQQGMVSKNDWLAAQVALADARQGSIQMANRVDLNKSVYNRLLGRELQQLVALEEIETFEFNESLELLTNRAINKRYELLVLREQINALTHQAAAIRAESGPHLALTGGYTFQENEYQIHEGQWGVNLGMQWKIFDAGLIRDKASSTEHRAAALEQQYDDLLTTIQLQVRQYWLDTKETVKRIKVSQISIAQAEENLAVNRDRYENGLSTNTDVLSAVTLRTRSQNNHANAVYDAVLASLRLKRAVSDL